jgi:hypothetical protein
MAFNIALLPMVDGAFNNASANSNLRGQTPEIAK